MGKGKRELFGYNCPCLSLTERPASLTLMPLYRAILLLLLAPSFSGAEPLEVKPVIEALSKAIYAGQTPGAVFWMEHADQRVTEVLGNRAQEPKVEAMTEDTIFDAASLTKVIATATSIMVLVEQEKISLEAPVSTYLPDFTGEGRERITVKQLLTHVSGLRPSLFQEPPWSGYAEGIRLACASVPENPPGVGFRYSDINFILLGEIVRRVSGQPLDAFAARQIFMPLQMTSTGFNPPAEKISRVAPTEKDESGTMLKGVVHDPSARRMGGVAGHAGLFTCASDLARFSRMILKGGELDGARILQASTVSLMTSVQTPPTVSERRGLGWDIETSFSRPRGWHPDRAFGDPSGFPLGSFGHTGFTGVSLWLDPASRSFVILLTTRLHPDGKGDVRDLYSTVGTLAAAAIPMIQSKKATGALLPRLKADEVPTVLNGIDVLRRNQFAPLKGLRVGLITNHTGIDNERHATIDLLANAPGVKLRALFSPEHGIRGTQDQDKITDSRDTKTGLPVFSLYGERRSPSAEQLQNLDALVFDIQDIGCRFYTYISTMQLAMEAAAKNQKKFIVLDRINPIGGIAWEGPVQPTKESFVACHPIPLRHGMTVGELARLMNHERGIEADLLIIRCEGWTRRLWMDQTGLPWIHPSPNMRSLTAATLYPGVGLLESALSVGRGTDRPFEIVGAPYVDDLRLAHEMNRQGLTGVRFIPIRFTPTASTFKDKPCGGVEMIVTNRDQINAVDIGIALACTFQKMHPDKFALKDISRLLLDETALTAIRKGEPRSRIIESWKAQLEEFHKRRAAFLLYPE